MKKINRIIVFSLLSLALILLASCDPSKKWEKEERRQIQDYLNAHADTVYISKPSGLYYFEILQGTGRMPVLKDTVSFRYTGTYLDGSLFTTNIADTVDYRFIIGSGEIITGIDEAVRYMKEGGIAKIITPSSLAYGSVGIWGYLPGYTPLLWQIQLVKVIAGSKK
jgi:FKBP-type peptidyl-prolyl cis-trans isomerase